MLYLPFDVFISEALKETFQQERSYIYARKFAASLTEKYSYPALVVDHKAMPGEAIYLLIAEWSSGRVGERAYDQAVIVSASNSLKKTEEDARVVDRLLLLQTESLEYLDWDGRRLRVPFVAENIVPRFIILERTTGISSYG